MLTRDVNTTKIRQLLMVVTCFRSIHFPLARHYA